MRPAAEGVANVDPVKLPEAPYEALGGSAAGVKDAAGPVVGSSEVPAASIQIEEGRTKQGRAFVKVYGTNEDALRVHREYQERGRQPTACKDDQFKKGAWFFWIVECG
jgi:hypothetical protein